MMKGKTCIVTGASSGIGKVVARSLATLGASVIAVCRDQGRGEATVAEIKAASANEDVSLMLCDLTSQASIRAFAERFLSEHDELHVLVNNAGLIIGKRELTVDGIEHTFALNHLGYFMVTNLLLDVLKKSAPARIVSVASEAEKVGKIDFDNLQGERSYSGLRAYGTSKLANIVFTYELARRLSGTGVTANAVHPGPVATNFGQTGGAFMSFVTRIGARLMLTPEQGAETAIYLASSPEVEGVTGKYFTKKKEIRSIKQSYDPEVQQRLWEVSARLTGLAA
jgi:NAD(P)-dependent dehydrogenase (short-subunit alcohol dehydrogenase family)